MKAKQQMRERNSPEEDAALPGHGHQSDTEARDSLVLTVLPAALSDGFA